MRTVAEEGPWRGVLAAICLAAGGLVIAPARFAVAQDVPAATDANAVSEEVPTPADSASSAEPGHEAEDQADESSPAPAPGADIPVPVKDPAMLTKAELASRVQAIFASRCFECHALPMRAGGLRLDTEEHVRRGGNSRRPLLTVPLANNELYQRISSPDRTYRMPKDADPLPQEEVETIRRWIESGAPWPMIAPAPEVPLWQQVFGWFGELIDKYEAEYRYTLPYIVGFLLLLLLLFAMLRMRAAADRDPTKTAGRLGWFYRVSQRVRPRELLLVLLLGGSVVTLAFARGHVLKIAGERDKLRRSAALNAPTWANTVYGNPPKPVRSRGLEKGVSRTYYRGNCERNPELFNGGNYLTAVFYTNLCNARHEPIEPGETVPPDEEIFLRWEIERAPGTTELLYSKDLMASVALAKGFGKESDPVEPPTHLVTLEPDWRWAGFVPLGKPAATMEGVIYMYNGVTRGETPSGTPSYAVEYRLRFSEGKLAEDSDLWMDSFGNGAFAPPTPDNLLPYAEWFDYNPMPVITGKNSQDPKLLGVDEHVESGLIEAPPQLDAKPPAEEPAVEPPPAEPPPAEPR